MPDRNVEREIGAVPPYAYPTMDGNVYMPHAISRRVFAFTDRTTALEESAAIKLVRFDESLRNHPYLHAIKQMLMRVESMATVRSDGVEPDLMLMLNLELLRNAGETSPRNQKRRLMKQFPHSSLADIEASFEAFRCMETLRWIDEYSPKPEGFTVDDIWTIYDMFMRGTKRERLGGIRTENATEQLRSTNNGVLYLPPEPEELECLLNDLVEFCNQKSVAPLARSIIEHFQLEAIKPVNVGLDRWGRMIALLSWKQSGIVENVFPPFSLTPGLQTQTHTELLIPYQTGRDFSKRSAMDALGEWVAHSSLAISRSVKYAATCRDSIENLEADWRSRVGLRSSDSVLDKLLTELAGFPLVTVSHASNLTERSYQTASEAINRLLQTGVLEPLTQGRRNRVFIARDAYDWIDQSTQHLFSKKASSREDFFR